MGRAHPADVQTGALAALSALTALSNALSSALSSALTAGSMWKSIDAAAKAKDQQ